MRLGTELVRVATGDVGDLTALAGLDVRRVADLVPHVARGHDEDDELWKQRQLSARSLVRALAPLPVPTQRLEQRTIVAKDQR